MTLAGVCTPGDSSLQAYSPAVRPYLSLTLEEHLDFLDRTLPRPGLASEPLSRLQQEASEPSGWGGVGLGADLPALDHAEAQCTWLRMKDREDSGSSLLGGAGVDSPARPAWNVNCPRGVPTWLGGNKPFWRASTLASLPDSLAGPPPLGL